MYLSEKKLKSFLKKSLKNPYLLFKLGQGFFDFLLIYEKSFYFIECKRYIHHKNFYFSMLTTYQKDFLKNNYKNCYVFFIGKNKEPIFYSFNKDLAYFPTGHFNFKKT